MQLENPQRHWPGPLVPQTGAFAWPVRVLGVPAQCWVKAGVLEVLGYLSNVSRDRADSAWPPSNGNSHQLISGWCIYSVHGGGGRLSV